MAGAKPVAEMRSSRAGWAISSGVTLAPRRRSGAGVASTSSSASEISARAKRSPPREPRGAPSPPAPRCCRSPRIPPPVRAGDPSSSSGRCRRVDSVESRCIGTGRRLPAATRAPQSAICMSAERTSNLEAGPCVLTGTLAASAHINAGDRKPRSPRNRVKGLVRPVSQDKGISDPRDAGSLPTSLPRGYSSPEDGSSGPVSRRGVDAARYEAAPTGGNESSLTTS